MLYATGQLYANIVMHNDASKKIVKSLKINGNQKTRVYKRPSTCTQGTAKRKERKREGGGEQLIVTIDQ